MERTALRKKMTEVVHAARDALHDESQAAPLWGETTALCDALEEHAHGENEHSMIVALREDIRSGARSTPELADEIVWFVRAIEHDLEDEEREAVVDEVVCCRDQIDG